MVAGEGVIKDSIEKHITITSGNRLCVFRLPR